MTSRTKRIGALCIFGGLSLVLAAASAVVAQATPRATRLVTPQASLAGSVRPGLTSSSLCATVGELDGLVVRRVDLFAANSIHFSFPATVTVRAPALVQKAARALCALPVMPHRRASCPVDLGITYHLSFSARGGSLPNVVADATGCQTVTGILETRWAALSPNFWRQLGKAMGLKNPTWDTFRGSGGAAG
ncbi:MAG: hypothetical protein ABSD85_11660 [Acidimicrobiales bacterium]|jgi:hypothetical protein